jgi:hypothetical protein
MICPCRAITNRRPGYHPESRCSRFVERSPPVGWCGRPRTGAAAAAPASSPSSGAPTRTKADPRTVKAQGYRGTEENRDTEDRSPGRPSVSVFLCISVPVPQPAGSGGHGGELGSGRVGSGRRARLRDGGMRGRAGGSPRARSQYGRTGGTSMGHLTHERPEPHTAEEDECRSLALSSTAPIAPSRSADGPVQLQREPVHPSHVCLSRRVASFV